MTAGTFHRCAAAAPKLLRIRISGGEPFAPRLGATDTLQLPWSGALPLLLPFPNQRSLLALGAANSSSEAPVRVCRVRLGVPMSEGSCVALAGGLGAEHVRTGVADDVAGGAYLGCESGAVLRLRLSPLRLEARVVPSEAPLVSSVFRQADGALWFGTASGDLLQVWDAPSRTPTPTLTLTLTCRSARGAG